MTRTRLAILYGGRSAEELIFGRDRVTTGAASDIQQATGIARRYVSQWGLSDAIGPILDRLKNDDGDLLCDEREVRRVDEERVGRVARCTCRSTRPRDARHRPGWRDTGA